MRCRGGFVLAIAWLLVAPLAWAEPHPPVTVYAAASLGDVLQRLGARFTADTGVAVRFSVAASSQLARQIESGSVADVFFPADTEWMDYLERRGLIRPGSRHDVLGNRLVLVAPSDSAVHLRLAPRVPLRAALGSGRLAIGDPDGVPAGRYARAALQSLGAWDEVADRLAPAENVRVALLYVARAEAPLGIVYATDARSEPRVRVVDEFPAATHAPITYPAALTPGATPDAQRFLDFLRGPKARPEFEAAGFQVLP